ncbi:hypothetical protein GW17_00012710 [Ensete ventricosum]|nr:hypothetical protein GW17_00012710 [Ensete ventricosum]
MEEASKRGYTLRELCEVEDRMGAERYFTTVMTRLKVAEGEDPLMPRWSAIAGSSQFWTKGPLSRKYLRQLESLKTQRRRLEEEVGILCSSLDGAQNDRARLEEDVLSLTEMAALLEAELKGEGAKVVAAYKALIWASRRWGGSATSSGTGWRSSGCGGNIRR